MGGGPVRRRSIDGGNGVAAATGLVYPVWAMIAMALSVSAVLANSSAGQLLSAEGVNADFTVGGERVADPAPAEQPPPRSPTNDKASNDF